MAACTATLRHLVALLELAKRRGLDRVVDSRLHRRARHLSDKRSRICRCDWKPNSTRSASGGSRPSPAATTRWTATSAGNAPNWPTMPLSTGLAPCCDSRASARSRRRTRSGITDEFILPTVIVGDAAAAGSDQPGDCDRVLQFPRRIGRGNSPRRCRDPAFAGFERRGPVVATSLSRHDDDAIRSRDLPVAVAFEPHDVVHPGRTCRSAKPDGRSSIAPRPRSTPMSRFSSMAAGKNRFLARNASSSPPPRSRPTICNRR